MLQLLPLFLSLSLALAVQTPLATQISRICFSRGDFIYLKDVKTGLVKRLAKGSYPSLSPDGQTLAFSTDNLASGTAKSISREIKLMDLQSNKLTSFDTLKSFLCYGAIWSPDGSKLAFSVRKGERWEVGVMDAASRDWHIITDKVPGSIGVSLNSWTGDSKSILCQDLDNIYQVGLDGSQIRKIPAVDVVDDLSYISSLTKFSLSSDGRFLLFDTQDLPDEPRPPTVWIYDLEKRSRLRLTPKTLAGYHPQWLPDGDEIVFTGTAWTRARKGAPGIYLIRKDGTHLELLVANAEEG